MVFWSQLCTNHGRKEFLDARKVVPGELLPRGQKSEKKECTLSHKVVTGMTSNNIHINNHFLNSFVVALQIYWQRKGKTVTDVETTMHICTRVLVYWQL